jgi:hypothetical protein
MSESEKTVSEQIIPEQITNENSITPHIHHPRLYLRKIK